jgi:uncharacterized protein YjbI with pentapeptide repeats
MSDNATTNNRVEEAVSQPQAPSEPQHQQSTPATQDDLQEFAQTLDREVMQWIEALNQRIEKREPFLKLLQNLSQLGILIAVISFFSQIPNQAKQARYQAWSAINSAQGNGGSGGRIDALQDLTQGCPEVGKIQRQEGIYQSIPKAIYNELQNFLADKVTYIAGDCVDLNGLTASQAYLPNVQLEATKLRDANLQEANLQKANFENADLTQANLRMATLVEANFSGAILEKANFNFMEKGETSEIKVANLKDADFREANLKGAKLQLANLENAKLQGANLENANLKETNLTGANLRDVKNLTIEQVKAAKNWQQAIYDEDFRQKLGLSPESVPSN